MIEITNFSAKDEKTLLVSVTDGVRFRILL